MEGSNSRMGLGRYRIPAIGGSSERRDHGPTRKFMALALKAEHFRNRSIPAFGRQPTSRRPLEQTLSGLLVAYIAANGSRTASAARSQRRSTTASSPIKLRNAETTATRSIRAMACARADRITPSRPSASAPSGSARPEGRGLNSKSLKGAPTAWVLMQGFFLVRAKNRRPATCFPTQFRPTGTSAALPSIFRRGETEIVSGC